MTLDSQAAILINDLDSMVHRIEALQAHPKYTEALNRVQEARQALQEGRSDLHQREMKARYGGS